MPEKIRPVYFFAGPDAGRKKERIDALAAAIASSRGEEPERHRFFPYDTDIADVLSLLRNGSLFSASKLVVVQDAHALGAPARTMLKEYFGAPAQDSVLVLATDAAPGSREYPRPLADALPKAAVEVFWEMFERDKRGWAMRFFRERGLQVDPAAVDLLLDVTEGTTDALREACGLLAFSAAEGGRITEEDADAALEHTRDESAYSLFDRLCRRDLQGVVEAYRKMRRSDPGAADALLSMLSEPMARLRDFSILRERRIPTEQAASQLKLRGGKRALGAYEDGSRRYSGGELDEAVRSLVALEAWLRTAPGDLRAPKTELWLCRTCSRPAR